jgi:hypothetical protein
MPGIMNTTDTPSPTVHSIRFSLSRWDVLRCRLWVVAHNWKLVAMLLTMCLIFPAVTYHTPKGIPYPLLYCVFYFVVAVSLMLLMNIVVQVVFHTIWLLANKNRGVVGEHEFEIRDDGLFEKTPYNESMYRWGGFHKTAASRKYIFVFVTDNNVHYIPFRVFASKEHADSFRAEIQRRANVA